MLDKWGFQPQQMLSCAGSTINPKEALDEQMTQMQQAMLGPNLAHKDCVDYHKEMMQTMVLKRDKLAQVLGTSGTDFETCEGKEEGECVGEVMRDFIRLRKLVYTSSGLVRWLRRLFCTLMRQNVLFFSLHNSCAQARSCRGYRGTTVWLLCFSAAGQT